MVGEPSRGAEGGAVAGEVVEREQAEEVYLRLMYQVSSWFSGAYGPM
jgi:hypothetical protein